MNKERIKANEKEIRQLTTNIELRAIDNEEKDEYIEGYALKFETWSEVLGGWFKEIISRNALDKCDMSNVVALFNHKEEYPLARNTVEGDIGKLELQVDNIGLKFRFKPTNTTYSKDLIENIRADVVNQCSFAFTIDYLDEDAEEWEYDKENDIYKRRINKIAKLYDISLVTRPAYASTEAVIGERSIDKVEEIKKQKENEILKRKLQLELELL